MAESDENRNVKPMVFPSQLIRQGRGEETPDRRLTEPSPDGESRLTLHILNTSASDGPEILSFSQSSITIGRSRNCEVRLDDRKQVVSGKHATISIEGGQLRVTDLASRNLTYLDGKQLEPETPYDISSGSTITIAEFAIQVELGGSEPAPIEAPTVFEESYENPFEEEVAKLAEVLERISALYKAEAPGRRDEALREATEEALGKSAGESRQILERIVNPE